MQHISIFEQASRESIKAYGEKRNLNKDFLEAYIHPQEDYLSASDMLPIFVVSDGVTLDFLKLIEDKKEYPNPSPAGEVARLFCEAVQKSAKDRYEDFKKEDIKDVFRDGNRVVAKYNSEIGQSNISGNITGFYSATGSFVVIKDKKAFWASICDAFFAHFDKEMNQKFMSTGLCTPYAVINGDEKMEDYIEQGVIDLEEGDRIFVFTDGFEHYMKNPEFTSFFKDWSSDLKSCIAEFSTKMNLENPENYGHERSVIAILYSSNPVI